MSGRTVMQTSLWRRLLTVALIAALVGSQTSVAWAGNFNRNGAVGGISINADGVVGKAVVKDINALAREIRGDLQRIGAEMQTKVKIRKISLKALEAACRVALTEDAGQLPDEVKYLGGLQRIQYVLVYPELNDIVLAGPAEGWKVDDAGNVVGVTTGRPVLQLDDLLVALRSVPAQTKTGISCSIDPTEQGYRQLNALLARQRPTNNRNLAALEVAMKEAFGPQQVTLKGIPAESHFARVLVAADYRMKRLAMNLDPSPVEGLTSYVSLLKNRRAAGTNVNPRWWLACNYEPLARSADGLAWELRGPGVKVMTEDDFVGQDGTVRGTGRKNALAQQWADMMTDNYEELSAQDAVFGELRNLMDMCVVAALIKQQGLFDKAACSLPLLTGTQSDLLVNTWNAPRTIPPECSFLKTRAGLVVTASGGVQIDSWNVAQNVVPLKGMEEVRTTSFAPATSAWWWN